MSDFVAYGAQADNIRSSVSGSPSGWGSFRPGLWAGAGAAVSEGLGGYLQGDDFSDPVVVANKAGTVAYEVGSWTAASKAGAVVGVATSILFTPPVGIVLGLATTWAVKEFAIDKVKDKVVSWLYGVFE